MRRLFIIVAFFAAWPLLASANDRVLDDRLHHLRIEGPREWSDFPEQPESDRWEVKFTSKANPEEWAIRLRQQDVKQRWNVLVNDKPIGRLVINENDMRVYLPLPKGTLVEGENRLRIEPQPDRRKRPDDIRIGEAVLIAQPLSTVLNEAHLEIEVQGSDTNRFLPARITITDLEGTLETTGAVSNDPLAVRPGTIYTGTGRAKIGLPAGRYRISAGRGFEYSLAQTEIEVKSADEIKVPLTIRREVPTEGYVACDTHVHTLTHSGHGDATVEERMITLAAEGIELPIATDHNVQIDHRPFAKDANVQEYFTPVIGNEVTTPVGHFNIFPVAPEAPVPKHRQSEWGPIFEEIYKTPGVKVAVLNHARDIHSGVRPFGPKRFNAAVGKNLDGWPMRFNAMEVLNSSATQSDPLQLFEDWMALLNRGYRVTPIGSSDSHDVARHFVGQGRTYIRADDREPGKISINEAVDNLIAGRVMVSYGLLVKMLVDGKYTSGDFAMATGESVRIEIQILGPGWVKSDELRLYANGRLLRQIATQSDALSDLPPGVLWEGKVTLPRPKHDLYLTAIAMGPGIKDAYWKTAKPYQPASPHWEPRLIGCSGAVWLDGDKDGRRSSAYDYAQRAVAKSGANFPELVKLLKDYDAAIAAQAAELYQTSGGDLMSADVQGALNEADDAVNRGFQDYLTAWRASQIAKSRAEE